MRYRGTEDFVVRDAGLSTAPGPRWLRRVAGVVTVIDVAAIAGTGTAMALGHAQGFDATPVVIGCVVVIFAGLVILGLASDAWKFSWYFRWFDGDTSQPDQVSLSAVPERDAIRDRERQALAQRLAGQRAARNQRAASGGSVSSADAGRPSHGSSEATTEP